MNVTGAGAERLRLPEIMDLKAAAPLRADILAQRGRAIELDGSGVQRIGGLGLQVLLAARDGWREDGCAFAVVEASEALCEGLALFGASLDELNAVGVCEE